MNFLVLGAAVPDNASPSVKYARRQNEIQYCGKSEHVPDQVHERADAM